MTVASKGTQQHAQALLGCLCKQRDKLICPMCEANSSMCTACWQRLIETKQPHQLPLALADERYHGLGDHEGTQHIHSVHIDDILN